MGKVILSGVSKGMTKPLRGTPISEFAVGSTVKMNVNGTAKDFIIVHQGSPSSLYDSSCNGTWLLMNDIYNSGYWSSSNVNDYENSTIHIYLNSTFLGQLDANIQSAIKQVKIPYRKGFGNGTTVTSGANGLSTKIFLLSGAEMNYTSSMGSNYINDGACLSYFSGLPYTHSKRIAYLNGAATEWWIRTPHTSSSAGPEYACFINTTGAFKMNTCINSYGYRPALVLPYTACVDKNGMVVA